MILRRTASDQKKITNNLIVNSTFGVRNTFRRLTNELHERKSSIKFRFVAREPNIIYQSKRCRISILMRFHFNYIATKKTEFNYNM